MSSAITHSARRTVTFRRVPGFRRDCAARWFCVTSR
ncbi:MAG: DUF4222 domain-containing protein [Rhodoferax sp.]|nr:DUF4222 domain-containing protein [Rhodoferax sp.]